MIDSRAVIAFWSDLGHERWYSVDPDLDAAIRAQFLPVHDAAARGNLAWSANAPGMLALILLLDQFPRNMFRGTARAFATDDRALALAERAVALGFDHAYPLPMRQFFYLPFMHVESLVHQRRCEALFRACQHENGIKYAIIHREIIERFGRFPHRNGILGRETTPQEQAFLDADGFSG